MTGKGVSCLIAILLLILPGRMDRCGLPGNSSFPGIHAGVDELQQQEVIHHQRALPLLAATRSTTRAKDLQVLGLLQHLCLKECFRKQSPCFCEVAQGQKAKKAKSSRCA